MGLMRRRPELEHDVSETVRPGLAPLIQETAPLRRKIAASLRQAIQAGTLRPGTRLVEKDLCQELNVSRTSLREALRELEAEGLLVTGPRGVQVARITQAEARNIYRVRAALEGLVAEQFATNASAPDLADLADAVAALERAYGADEFERIVAAKDHFYEVLCVGAGNLIVLDLLTRLNARINRLRSLTRANPARGAVSLGEVKAIAAALLAHDGARAKAAAVAHVEAAAAAALRQSQAFPAEE